MAPAGIASPSASADPHRSRRVTVGRQRVSAAREQPLHRSTDPNADADLNGGGGEEEQHEVLSSVEESMVGGGEQLMTTHLGHLLLGKND